jgi:sterol desaturase/sphingolipid hydroxylase (fatty acid hydroxylase superfamily)
MSSLLQWPIIFCGFGLLFTAVELMRPARPLNYRAVIKDDLVTLGIYGLLFLPVSIWVSRRLVTPDHVFLRSLLDLPLLVRLILYYALADLGLYAVHRLMHSRYVWPIHRGHHSPPYNLPFAFCAPLLHHAPAWLFMLIFAEGFFQNNWMHMNVTWRSRWLEWVLVTPRYHHIHHIHHSNRPEHHGANLVSRLTIWDQIFGTYVDPEDVRDITFGIERHPSPARLALGI